ENAAQLQVPTDRGERCASTALAAQQLDHLHRRDRESEFVSKLEAAGICHRRPHAQAMRASTCPELVDELRVRVDRGDLIAAPSQVEGDAASAGADVEDGATGLVCELPP